MRVRSVLLLACALLTAACGDGAADAEITVGLVTNNPNGLRNVAGFVEGMAEVGYIEGQNVTYLYAGEPVRGDDLDKALSEMVEADVDLIFTAGTPTGVAAYEATQASQIPVVFGVIADPIRAGVMTDLNSPGGNMSGVKLDADQSRRLELLIQVAPSVDEVLVPFNPDDAAASSAVDQIHAIAADLGVDLVLREARDPAAVGQVLASLPQSTDAIFLVPDSTVNAHLAAIVELAADRGIPTSGPSIAQVEGGALMTYGFVHHDAGAQAAHIADQVLRGADPGTLPVENTESFLAINLATAADLGLEIPEVVLRQADILLRGDADG